MRNKINVKRKILYIFLLFILVILFSLFSIPNSQEKKSEIKKFYRVSRVIDGDTIEVEIDGKYERVRLLGINTPEVDSPYTKEECYGPEASAYLKKILKNKYVFLVPDEKNENRDKYNRLLRYVFMKDGTFIEEDLIKKGYAYNYIYFPFKFKEKFSIWEKEARDKKIGLWGKCEN